MLNMYNINMASKLGVPLFPHSLPNQQNCILTPPRKKNASLGSKGVKQWPIKWCTSSMMLHKITPSVNYNSWLKLLDIELNKPTNQNSKLLSQLIKKSKYKTFGRRVIDSPMCSPSLIKHLLLFNYFCGFFEYLT